MDPASYTCSEALKGGLVVTLRAVRADDRERIAAAFRKLERASVYRRFFAFRSEPTGAELGRITARNTAREVGLVATVGVGADEVVVGSGRYIGSDAGAPVPSAEIAFVVEEDYQGLGIASRLLQHLALIARACGIRSFEAEVLAENQPMLAVFARSGLPMRTRQDGNVVHVTLALADP